MTQQKKPGRFFTKDDFFKQLQTSLAPQKPSLGGRLREAIRNRLPKRR